MNNMLCIECNKYMVLNITVEYIDVVMLMFVQNHVQKNVMKN